MRVGSVALTIISCNINQWQRKPDPLTERVNIPAATSGPRLPLDDNDCPGSEPEAERGDRQAGSCPMATSWYVRAGLTR
ncbi:hypothetical protein DPEC_G00286850 [Dallia pectoralis]|uniref:Uncharacterized protein n=1 Tax=Dallia pectoralis TaxID=75939 RepID=A0ACC2FJZ5_DALPE|nr:hypothetical protein DPEC_G00286850 [Dallia pectoralis]